MSDPTTEPTTEPIFETVITTRAADGQVHIAPMGVRLRGDLVLLMPFRPSTTLANIEATGRAVLNLITDVRVFAGCVTGRRDWPTVALDDPADGVRLDCALVHAPLVLQDHDHDAQRPTLTLRRTATVANAPFGGMNRAQAAVVEGAVLVSRLHLLSAERIDREWAYLQIAIDRTAGNAERQAWAWLNEAVAAHRAGAAP